MFISVVPPVWHILVRVCCDAEFLPCFIRLDSIDSPTTSMAAVSDGGYFHNCTNCITRMPSIVFDVHTVGVGCKDKVCNMSVRCYECRDWSDSCKLVLPHS